MKRNITFFILLACTIVSGQNINDVLRYSGENLQGTARYQGLSGAFGALGGDLSSLNVNPAGSAVFNNSQFSLTASNANTKINASYFNGNTFASNNAFEINQVGGVLVFKNTKNPNWKKVSLAFNYDLANNFDGEIFIAGLSNQGIDNYFLANANGVPFGPLLIQDDEFIEEAYLDIGAQLGFIDQQAFLGYYGGLIDPMDETNDNNTSYVSNAKYSSVNQKYSENTLGHNGKFTANLASQYNDNLSIGAAINIHNVLYDKLTKFTESGYDLDSPIKNTSFENRLKTTGTGFSFSMGAIAKLNQFIRVGGSYQSPTWYRLSDETSQRINSDLADDDIGFINFNVVNVFDKYTIKTPEKLTASMAVIFGRQGLLSFDYGYQDMSKAELRPTSDPSFASENAFMATQLGAVSTVRLGGEYRIEAFSLRAGYRFEESPYDNGAAIGDLKGYSLGIGYDFGGSKLDLAYSYATQDRNKQLYDVGLTKPATISSKNTVLGLSYILNF
ncbi:Outer membrane protein transport protein (OMPP1/FadL/TodX) [Arenibacter nanhaiticus]|uniref:Outer membrane protein transport protein (OMPP1/FadL/TodX) n=1 Tax=Arenibacter nanhaiticus TaxID=558155 RepID=A0A1M6JT30_9FLAO|nr:outer membrane protein transport protein [Arenibacter nanhaiticus]SHJ49792.1 Outer membrane protein transport protein (OMPP1/FadL/TodX) [Arenibacter nanhaiticus]